MELIGKETCLIVAVTTLYQACLAHFELVEI